MKINSKLFSYTLVIMILLVGCSSSKNEDSKKAESKTDNSTLAIVKQQPDSPYTTTFKDLNLGPLFNFDLQLPQADKTLVTIWVEGYSKGKKLSPSPLVKLSYGHSPKKEGEGSMGLGIIKAQNNKARLFLYAPGITTGLNEIETSIINEGISSWNYAMDDKEVKLNPGDERILGTYRETISNQLSGYDPHDKEQLKEMIESDDTLLLLKMKVENN